MKILHVVHGYTPAVGGTEYLIQKISENLVERYHDEVTVYTTTAYNCELFWRSDQPQLPAGTETINGVIVRRFPVFNKFNEARRLLAGSSYKFKLPFNDWFRAFYNGPLIPGMTRAIANSTTDVIAGSSFPLLHMHYMQWAGQRSGRPVIFYGGIHTADAFGFDRPMIYKAIQKANRYIAYTSFERDYLIGRGIAAEKIHVIGIGVDADQFAQADGVTLRQRLGWGTAPVIAFVGQQVPHKGIDILLEAMPHVWQHTPDACLLIAGAKTTYSTTIKAWYDQLSPDFKQRVAILDNFSEEEKPSIFAVCDMLVFPSGHESFGFVILEAWSAGKPVIGARVGAIPTVIDEEKNGLLIEHRNTGELIQAIKRLLQNETLRKQLGQAGQQKVYNQYTWEIVTARYREVYAQALSSK